MNLLRLRSRQPYSCRREELGLVEAADQGKLQGTDCAYYHMDGGRHQVAHKSLWNFGLRKSIPTSQNSVLRRRWIDLCSDCHEETGNPVAD